MFKYFKKQKLKMTKLINDNIDHEYYSYYGFHNIHLASFDADTNFLILCFFGNAFIPFKSNLVDSNLLVKMTFLYSVVHLLEIVAPAK